MGQNALKNVENYITIFNIIIYNPKILAIDEFLWQTLVEGGVLRQSAGFWPGKMPGMQKNRTCSLPWDRTKGPKDGFFWGSLRGNQTWSQEIPELNGWC